MQYELYLDVFFLVNFMMDFLLLMFVRRILACTATQGRIFLGALVGAAVTCVVIILPLPYTPLKILMFHGFVNVIMLKIGLRVPWGRTFLKAFLFLYIGAFLLGGILEVFRPYVKMGSLFFVLSVMGYYVAVGIWTLVEALLRHNNTSCEVLLFEKEECCLVKALIDTGNKLKDPVTKKPVSIIGQDTAKQLKIGEETVRYISYHSVGNIKGVLPVYVLDKMTIIQSRKKTEMKAPVIAVCGRELEQDSCQMILNPDIFNCQI